MKSKPKQHVKVKVRLPPCPDPEMYIAVKGKNGWHWRRKRGTIKAAPVNPVLNAFAENAKYSMPAARKVIEKLLPYTEEFSLRSQTQSFSANFTKSIMVEGKMSWSFFQNLDLNKSCALDKLMSSRYTISIQKGMCVAEIPLFHGMIDIMRRPVVSGFTIELILVSGDPAKPDTFRTESDASPEYPIKSGVKTGEEGPNLCTLSLQLPQRKPYIILMKVTSKEGRFTGRPRNTALKVVMVN